MSGLKVSGFDLKIEKKERILSLHLTYRGFGYSIFDDPKTVFDWAHCSVEQHDPDVFRERISNLVTNNSIDKVLSYHSHGRPTRIQRNIVSLKGICKKLGIEIETVSKDDITNVFDSFGSYTKYQRAGLVATFLPELSHKLPPKRKVWASEDLRMSIFDSACLALAYFYLKK